MSSNDSAVAQEKTAAGDADTFKTYLATLSAAQKRSAVYSLLHDLLGDRPEQECGVYDPVGFLYLCLVPPGQREYFRMLEHPERDEQLRKAAAEPTSTLDEILERMGIAE